MPTAVSVYLKRLFYTRSRKRDVKQKTAASILDCCSLRASIWQLEKDGKSPCFEFVLMPLPAVHGGVTWRGAAPRNSCFRHCVKTGTVQSIVVVIDLTAPRRRSIVRLHAASHSPPQYTRHTNAAPDFFVFCISRLLSQTEYLRLGFVSKKSQLLYFKSFLERKETHRTHI